MKFATPLVFVPLILLSSCASRNDMALNAPSGSASASPPAAVSTMNSAPSSGATPMTAYRGAQQVAGALNTFRTLGSLF